MDVLSIIRALRDRLWILITFPLISVVCAIFIVQGMDKEYKSTAQMATGFTSDETVNLSQEGKSSQFETNTRFINTVESMKSIPVVSLVSYSLILHDLTTPTPFRQLEDNGDYDFVLDQETTNKMIGIFRDRLRNFKALNSFDIEDQLALQVLTAFQYDFDYLHDQLSVYRRSISDFIVVDFLSENPVLSAFVVNTLCQEFIRYNKALKTDLSTESIEFLSKALAEKKKNRDEMVAALSEFKVSSNIYNYDAESAGKIAQISNYEISKEIEEKNISALTLSLKTVADKINSIAKFDQSEVAKVNQRIIDLRRRIDESNASDNESVRLKATQLRDELQLEIARLERMNTESNPEVYEKLIVERDRLELELQIAKSNLLTTSTSLANLKASISGFANKEARLAELERDLLVVSEEYRVAQERYADATNKASIIGSSLRQIIQGQPSVEPESSKRILLVALAGVGSFVFCVVSILLVDASNFNIRNHSRLESQTGLKNIVTLNQVDIKPLELSKVFHSKGSDKNINTFVHSLRKFRFGVQNERNQILLITSTRPNVGKSFCIVSLSYTLSLLNKKVLIIDTNFKTSSLTKLLIPEKGSQGLLKKATDRETYLLPRNTDSIRSDESITDSNGATNGSQDKSIIHETRFDGVDIIGNYGGSDSPSEILADRNFGDMLDNLSIQYDYVILEGPSLNEYSDTRELIEYVDKIIAIFDAQTTLNEIDHESIKYLKTMEGKLLGSVLNNAKLKELSI